MPNQSGCQRGARPSDRARRAWLLCVGIASLIVSHTAAQQNVGEYPLVLTVGAEVSDATTTVSSSVNIRVDRLMEENRRQRVTDALTHGGYPNFLNALRPLPAIGTIEHRGHSVEVRYAHEQPEGTDRRLVLIADR